MTERYSSQLIAKTIKNQALNTHMMLLPLVAHGKQAVGIKKTGE